MTDAAARNLLLAYTSGKLTSVTDAESRLFALNFDGSNRLQRITAPALADRMMEWIAEVVGRERGGAGSGPSVMQAATSMWKNPACRRSR